jgi:hypothetical protein
MVPLTADHLPSVHVPGPWRTLELSFQGDREYPNPYLDVEATVAFLGPDAQVVHRPAFWDGGRTWRVRFAPPRPGVWRYRSSSGDPSDRGLDGREGELVCGNEPAVDPFHAHGFLRVSADGSHLVHADGAPFFWLGDTHWRLTSERWDASNKPGWSSQFRGMVDRRVAQGFTVYQTNVLSWTGPDSPDSFLIPGTRPAQLDVERVRSVLDPRMAYIAERGLLNAVGVAWHGAIDGDVEGMVRFARYLVARYGSHPVVWTLAGEVAGYDPELRQARLDGWRRVALGIRDADDYDHPRTAHLTAERPIPSYYQDEDWLSCTLNQHGHGDVDPDARHYRSFLAAHPVRPLIEGEAMYEGLTSVEYPGRRTVTDTMVRHSAYRAIQSGCCGYSYGAQGVWNGAWDRDDAADMWGDLPWFDGIDLPGADQLGHLRRFFEALEWTALRPDPDCFVTENVFNASLYRPDFSADASRRTVVGFFAETYRLGGGQASLTGLADLAHQIQWFDPRSGEYLDIGDGRLPSEGVINLPDKPDDQDWVLLARGTTGAKS